MTREEKKSPRSKKCGRKGERGEREQVGVFDVALDHQGGSGRAAWASPTRRHGASGAGHGGGEREREFCEKPPITIYLNYKKVQQQL